MANQSISQLPVATTLTGDELTVVVQNGVTKQTQVADIANAVAPGKFIDYLYFDTGSDLIVVYTDATTENLGPIPGYIAATINSSGHLILTNSTGGTTDAGSVFASLTQTFTTVNNETATLPNSQRLVAGSNISLTSGTNTLTIAASGSAGSLNSAGTGIIVKDTSTSVVARTLTSTAGISITNPDGLAGNPIISPASKLLDIQNLATTGILAVVGGTTVVDRNIVGTASQITVVGGDGSGNPTISITPSPVLPGTGSVTIPTGTTAQRPGDLPGQLRFNTTLNVFEGQNNSGVWQVLALGGGVTSISLGTGLTGSPNPITSTGTISITDTGVTANTYGSATQVPVFAVNAQGQITSVTNTTITAGGIGAITAVNGTANEITTSQVGTVVTASLPTALTFTGKTVTNGTFNMTAATVGADTVTTNTAAQALTNKTINGSLNTLSNIANSSLTNSSVTLGTSTVALGGTLLAPAGFTSVSVTANPTTALQLTTKQYVDGLVATGLTYHAPVQAATTQSLAATTGGTVTYNAPGPEGVGATITLSVALTVLDGYTLANTNRILVKNEVNSAYNGVYTWATGGTVLTRATDANTYGTDIDQLSQNDYFFTQNGTVNKGTSFVVTTVGTINFTTTPITFAEFSSSLVYTGGTGITVAGTVISITNTAVTAGAYGSASSVGTFTVNAQGQLTLAGSTAISIPASAINTAIPNSGLANSSITINGSAISLGGSVSVGTVTSVTGTAPVVSSGGTTPAISMAAANTTTNGYLTSTDWNTFNSKGTGSVTSVSGTGTVNGLTLTGTVTTSGSLTLGGTLDLSAPPTIGNATPNTGAFTTLSATGQISSTATGSATTGAGQFYLNGATSNRIDWAAVGTGSPAFTTRSAGTKLLLYPALSGSQVDYAIGIDAATLWSSVPSYDPSFSFKWYGAQTQVASLTGTGAFTAIGGISGGTF